ncbi:polyphosphate--glucose phosphotransferase [Nigerium massiliense]|uniref:polyphosphate--glucose phosphotransferase n=1 Tax=Nigerium massiliense TaxID=1522317 RepID=UPI000590DD0D|nr:ROK family protein [Nigerium massiliense]
MITLGIDVGGSGVKGAPVDLSTGELTSPTLLFPTPRPATPEAVTEAVVKIVDGFADSHGDAPVGVTLPGVIRAGVMRTAANLDESFVGCDIHALVEDRVGRPVTVLNDADAAGIGEERYGAARGVGGTVLVVTLGTGIGTALLVDGVLVPNIEFGHMEIDGHDAETRAAASVRDREQLGWVQYAERLQRFLTEIEKLFNPDLIVVGGGVSANADHFLPLLRLDAPIVPATLHNKAGIVGAAAFAVTAAPVVSS